MMASVSRAGMSSRRADAAPDDLQHFIRNARTRRTIVITTHALAAQCSRGKFLAEFGAAPRRNLKLPFQEYRLFPVTSA
jgi:hypothetical protein